MSVPINLENCLVDELDVAMSSRYDANDHVTWSAVEVSDIQNGPETADVTFSKVDWRLQHKKKKKEKKTREFFFRFIFTKRTSSNDCQVLVYLVKRATKKKQH